MPLSYTSGFDNRHVALAVASIPAGAYHKTDVLAMLEEVRRLCKKHKLNFGLVWAQIWHECGGFNDPISVWKLWKNPGGIKSQSGQSFMKYYNGVDAARAMMSHVGAYSGAETYFNLSDTKLDPRAAAVERIVRLWPNKDIGNFHAVARSWAEDPNYESKVTRIYVELFQLQPATLPVLIVAGHRNLSGGNPAEEEKTDDLARAYLAEFRRRGVRAEWWQQIDGDSDPDDSLSYLAGVAIGCNDWLARQPNGGIMLDLHFEGGGQPGIFTIFPDWPGDENPKDQKWARAISTSIADHVGLSVRTSGVTDPGAMSERQSGVGGQGFRLGMFNLTAGQREKCIRLIIEHGSLDKNPDAAKIAALGIGEYARRAAEAAVGAILGLQSWILGLQS